MGQAVSHQDYFARYKEISGLVKKENWNDDTKERLRILYSRYGWGFRVPLSHVPDLSPLNLAIQHRNKQAIEFLIEECHANLNGVLVCEKI